ncbi:hypothetical protein D4768_28835 [Rhodococcus erythropolis]|nr:hypothetical protein D4768_28835 [Rhodococcus erythropolis]
MPKDDEVRSNTVPALVIYGVENVVAPPSSLRHVSRTSCCLERKSWSIPVPGTASSGRSPTE